MLPNYFLVQIRLALFRLVIICAHQFYRSAQLPNAILPFSKAKIKPVSTIWDENSRLRLPECGASIIPGKQIGDDVLLSNSRYSISKHMSYSLAIILHLLAINVWIGGTFFTVVILPRTTSTMGVQERHILMLNVFQQFFFWVWFALVMLLASGGWMIFDAFGAISQVPAYILIMMSTAVLMMCLFLIIFFGPYHDYMRSIHRENWMECERSLGRVRLLSKINMVMGICIVMTIGVGPHLPA